MSDKYSSDFKAKVALAAVAESREVIAELAKKYNVSEDEIVEWTSQLNQNAAAIFSGSIPQNVSASDAHGHPVPESEDYEVDVDASDEDTISSISTGVMSDQLNYSKLIFWSAFGTGLVVVFVVALVYFTQYSVFETQQSVSEQSVYYDIQELDTEQEMELNSFGVVDPEQGIYRIPIDSAINRIAE